MVAMLDDKLKGSLSGFVGSLLLRDYGVLVAFTEYNRNVIRLEPPLICRPRTCRPVHRRAGLASVARHRRHRQGLREKPDEMTVRPGAGERMAGLQRTAIGWAMGTAMAGALVRAASNRTLLERLAVAFFLGLFLFGAIYAWVQARLQLGHGRLCRDCAREPRYRSAATPRRNLEGGQREGAREAQLLRISSTATPTIATSGKIRSTSSRSCRCTE